MGRAKKHLALLIGLVHTATLASVGAADESRYAIDTDGVSKKIINGQAITVADFNTKYKWFAQVFMDGYTGCGGSLIADRWVVTAAHCTADTDGEAISLTSMKVVIGAEASCALTDCSSAAGAVERKVVRVINHPAYTAMTSDSDIALLELESPVTTIVPVAYRTEAFTPQDAFATYGKSVEVFGFGQTKYPNLIGVGGYAEDSTPAAIQLTTVQLINQYDCNRAPYAYTSVTGSMVCAAGYGSNGQTTDSCQGDSGGPLYSPTENKLVGVVSWGQGCAEAANPGVYVNIGNFKSWIATTMASSSGGVQLIQTTGTYAPPVAVTTASPAATPPQCLSSNNVVSMQNPYVFNGVAYDASKKIGMNVGTYTFTGITAAHPFGIYITNTNLVEVTSGTVYSVTGGYTFYTGTIVVNVKAAFGTASYGCALHGYMGGQNRLEFNSACSAPATAIHSSGKKTCGQLGWTKIVNGVCGESDANFGPNGVDRCYEASLADATAVCETVGARLCTTEEVNAGATATTGCGFDTGLVWTGTWCGLGPEGGKFYAAIGGGNNREWKCKNPKKSYPVRCCANVDISASTAPPPTTTTTFPFLSNRKNCATLGWETIGSVCGESDKAFKKGLDKCFTNKNHPDAERKCLKLGARMCSQADIEAGVGVGTGCNFDSKFLWTSTSCGANSYVRAKGNGMGERVCTTAKSKGSMRCCSDVNV